MKLADFYGLSSIQDVLVHEGVSRDIILDYDLSREAISKSWYPLLCWVIVAVSPILPFAIVAGALKLSGEGVGLGAWQGVRAWISPVLEPDGENYLPNL